MLAAGSSGQTLVLHLQGLGFVCSLWDHGDSRLRPMSLRRLRLMSLQASRGRCTGPGPLRSRQDRAAAVRPEPLVQQRRHENGAGAAPLFGSALLWLPCYGSRPQPVGPCPGGWGRGAAADTQQRHAGTRLIRHHTEQIVCETCPAPAGRVRAVMGWHKWAGRCLEPAEAARHR